MLVLAFSSKHSMLVDSWSCLNTNYVISAARGLSFTTKKREEDVIGVASVELLNFYC